MHARSITRRIVIVLGSIIVLAILLESTFGFIEIGAAQKVRAVLAPSAYADELPKHITMEIDGHKADYFRGTSSYNQLLGLLRLRHLDAALQDAGPYPPVSSRKLCGEMTISHLGLPFHYKMARSTVNPNYLWMGIPWGNGRPGIASPVLIDNDRLGPFVQNTHAHDRNLAGK